MILDTEERIREYTDKGLWGTDTLADLFDRLVRDRPDALALVDPPNRGALGLGLSRRLTYREASDMADRLAGALLDAGVGRDDIVLVQMPNTVELVLCYLAAARIGAVVSPVPVQFRTHELRQVLPLLEPRAWLTVAAFGGFRFVDMAVSMRGELPSIAALAALGDDLPGGVASLDEWLSSPRDRGRLDAWRAAHPVSANDVATICWTSGTEAEPKGVPRSHNQWISIAWATVDGCELQEGDALLNPFPMVNMSGIGGMLVPWLLTGGKLVMHHPLDLNVFLAQIPVEGIRYTVAPPTLLNMLLVQPALLERANIRSLRNIGSGSAPLSGWMVSQYQDRYGVHVVNLFGSNEGMALTCGPREIPDPAGRARYFPRLGAGDREWGSRVARGMKTRLVDPQTDEEITRPGVPGELRVQGPTVFPGYYKRPDLTSRAFDAEGHFCTGDLFEIAGARDDRYLFVGRLKDVIIRGGVNISAEEVEALILTHPGVAEVAVVGYPDPRLGEIACAVVVPHSGQEVTLESVLAHLRERDIAAYKLPEQLVVVDALPRNAVGKVLKRILRQSVHAG
jgi:acyl-CoA synthetase (AMP-forming)/AMP-acid ligase II